MVSEKRILLMYVDQEDMYVLRTSPFEAQSLNPNLTRRVMIVAVAELKFLLVTKAYLVTWCSA